MARKLLAVCKLFLVCVLVGIFIGLLLQKSPAQKKFESLLAQAKAGNATAQRQVAAAYLEGQPIPVNLEEAVQWYEKSAAQADVWAAYELAHLYLAGDKVTRNIPAGIKYLKIAADKNHAPSQYALGRLYQTGTEGLPEQIGQAVWWWLKAAQQEDTDAQVALEMMRAEQPDLLGEVEQLFQAEQHAQEGDGSAAYTLAEAYRQGNVLVQDETQMVFWYKRAATQQYFPALYALFQLYNQPNGPVTQDENKGLEYLQQAAEGGFAPAQYEVGERIFRMAQIPSEYKIAQQWFELAAKQKYAPAAYMLGIMQMQGYAGKKDSHAALKNFEQAAELGNADAQYVLGQSYLYGLGVSASPTKARQWLQLAQENGNEQAKALLQQMK